MILRYDREITYTNESGAELEIRFDRQRLRSVLENLLNNALESQGAAADRKPVEILLSVLKGKIEIAVLDRGEGISQEKGEKIFDPFYTSKINGSGVGLSISKRFVEAAGGKLSVQNRKGGGSEARIVVPRGSQ
jgi:two-component system sensor histidine kinase HydH